MMLLGDDVEHTTMSADFSWARWSSQATDLAPSLHASSSAFDCVRFITRRQVAPALRRHFAANSLILPAPSTNTSLLERSPSTPMASSTAAYGKVNVESPIEVSLRTSADTAKALWITASRKRPVAPTL